MIRFSATVGQASAAVKTVRRSQRPQWRAAAAPLPDAAQTALDRYDADAAAASSDRRPPVAATLPESSTLAGAARSAVRPRTAPCAPRRSPIAARRWPCSATAASRCRAPSSGCTLAGACWQAQRCRRATPQPHGAHRPGRRAPTRRRARSAAAPRRSRTAFPLPSCQRQRRRDRAPAAVDRPAGASPLDTALAPRSPRGNQSRALAHGAAAQRAGCQRLSARAARSSRAVTGCSALATTRRALRRARRRRVSRRRRGNARRDAGIAHLSYRPARRGARAAGRGAGRQGHLLRHRRHQSQDRTVACSTCTPTCRAARWRSARWSRSRELRAPFARRCWLAITENHIGPHGLPAAGSRARAQRRHHPGDPQRCRGTHGAGRHAGARRAHASRA